MEKYIRLSFFIIYFFLINSLIAQPLPNELKNLIYMGKNEIYHFRLDNALDIFRLIQKKYPDLPHGYFYESYIYMIFISQDETNKSLDSLLHATINNALNVGKNYRVKIGETPESLYYLGLTYGLLGIYHVVNRNYFRGYIYGRKGKNYLEKVVKLDSTYYDAYLGLGIFHYYVDLLPGIIKFFASILGFKGDRSRGMQEIKLTRDNGKFLRVEADFAHACIRYFLEGAKQEALQDFFRLYRIYPSNPAVILLIGYYYRRIGNIETAISYFQQVPDKYSDKLPEISVIKYYNLGVCYYRMNQFELAEKTFNDLENNSLRKSKYYKAAIAYYLGLLADIRFEREKALEYYNRIPKNKKTKYWYYASQIHRKIPMDSLMLFYLIIENDIIRANFKDASIYLKRLLLLVSNPGNLKHQFFIYMVKDLQARLAFREGKIIEASKLYKEFIEQVRLIEDEFQRAWIYIQYARVLRELKDWQNAEKYLNKASDCDDEYTNLIIDRERFIIKQLKGNQKV